jgi:hypothetical protein
MIDEVERLATQGNATMNLLHGARRTGVQGTLLLRRRRGEKTKLGGRRGKTIAKEEAE